MSFNDKVVWITGASSGIGEHLTYALHERGAKLIISSRRRETLETVKENCKGDTSTIHILPLDLSVAEELPHKTREVLDLYGRIDYLFNNGGVSQRSLAVETSMNVVREVMETNFFGTIGLTKAVLPSMIERQSGHIIVTSSVMGKIGTRLRSTYAASKHALHGWFDCLRQEVMEHNISVSIVCPGFIKTNVTLNALEGDGTRYGKMGRGQENGMDPDVFVRKLLPKILDQQNEIYIGGKEILTIYLKRYMPGLLNKILQKIEVT